MPKGQYKRTKPMTKEWRNKISRSLKGKSKPPRSAEHSKKISVAHKGKHYSPSTEFKKGFTSQRKGKKFPAEGGPNKPNWLGGRKLDKDGYVLVYAPNHPYAIKNYIREHRLIMEKYIGRHLRPEEVVHHKGAKNDNRIKMLKLFANDIEHRKYEKLKR